jgi:sec-independent protein translocase protein TatC
MSRHALPILAHIRELRKRIIISAIASIICFIPCYLFFNPIFEALIVPLSTLSKKSGSELLYATSIFEGFVTKLKVALIAGLVLAIPVHIYNIARFIFPGLHKTERRFIIIALFFGTLLALLSTYLGYFKILPYTTQFLSSSAFIPKEVGILLPYNNSVFYVVNFLVYSMLLFQLPLILEILMVLNVVSRKTIWKNSRYIIVSILLISAIVTPPDIISQMSLGIPLILLFLITILIAKIFNFGVR